MSDIPKLKLLVIIVNRDKGEMFATLLQDFEVNAQMYAMGHGTVNPNSVKVIERGTEKSVVLAAVREDKVESILSYLKEKFKSIKKGKGVAFTIPISAVMGASVYQFLSNQPKGEV